jgi:hypothetical protein
MTRVCLAIGAGLLLASCGRAGASASLPPATAQTAASQPPSPAIPHGDHNPRFGGVVYMDGDLHFEVVLGRDGRHRVYFSDAMRNELPAATASEVTLTVSQQGRAPEEIHLAIDDTGEVWAGQGHRIETADASARVAYVIRGRPFFIDVPVPK